MQLDALIDDIREQHRVRYYAMEQRMRSNLALGSFLRLMLGWSKTLPEAESKRIKAQAIALVKLGELDAKARKKEKVFEIDEPDYLQWSSVILASIGARAPFSEMEKDAKNELERLAHLLPVWPWCEAIKGFGPCSLAVIVGEAGDLSSYPRKGHLWKRLGLAVMGDVRQGGLAKTASAAQWIEHGYSAQRRSRVWNIGESLIKTNGAGEYRQCYLTRKVYERERAEAAGIIVLPSAEIKSLVKKGEGRVADFMSEMHIHRRAQRYMEKRLLRNLWQAWRRAKVRVSDSTIIILPVAA